MTSRRRPLAAALAAALLLLAPAPTFAWGKQGHRITGDIATRYLSPRARAAVKAILGPEGLAEASTWPDFMRSAPGDFWQKESTPWHYVTVAKGRTYAEVGAPPEGDAITALSRYTAVLQDRKATLADRQLALRFIVHIIGDLHQPLHVGIPGDRGGNDVAVTLFRQPSNLHSVWDSGLIDSEGLSYTEYAGWLAARIAPADAKAWSVTDPGVWMAESAALRDTIYPATPDLSYDYVFRHKAEVEDRLEHGGVRIAAYLNAVFAGKLTKPE